MPIPIMNNKPYEIIFIPHPSSFVNWSSAFLFVFALIYLSPIYRCFNRFAYLWTVTPTAS